VPIPILGSLLTAVFTSLLLSKAKKAELLSEKKTSMARFWCK
jgi:hypothetical protein